MREKTERALPISWTRCSAYFSQNKQGKASPITMKYSQRYTEETLSLSSTISVERNTTTSCKHKRTRPLVPDRSRQRLVALTPTLRTKGVHFNECFNEYYHNRDFCKEEIQELWYSKLDLQDFRKDLRYSVKQAQKSELKLPNVFVPRSSYLATVTRIYELSCAAADTEEADDCLSASDKMMLHTVIQLRSHWIGLERSACKAIREDKSNRQQDLLDAVLALQNVCRTNDHLSDIIMSASLAISRPSRLFAHQMAVAQL